MRLHGYVYFNPRSRTGSDFETQINETATKAISIHAPARGATVMDKEFIQLFDISIHAPARGATDD